MRLTKLLAPLLLALSCAPVHAFSVFTPLTILENGIPVGIPSSGSFANNGALSGLTALPTTYANAYLFFPAAAICAGTAAGFYYTQMSSATAGTVFNNTYSSGEPTIPASPTAFACTGSGAYTQSLTSHTLITLTVPAGFLGIQGGLHLWVTWSFNSSGNNKTYQTLFGGSLLQNNTVTTSSSAEQIAFFFNRGVANAQVIGPPGSSAFGPTATANSFYSVNTALAQNLTAAAQLAAATDFVILEGIQAVAFPWNQ